MAAEQFSTTKEKINLTNVQSFHCAKNHIHELIHFFSSFKAPHALDIVLQKLGGCWDGVKTVMFTLLK